MTLVTSDSKEGEKRIDMERIDRDVYRWFEFVERERGKDALLCDHNKTCTEIQYQGEVHKAYRCHPNENHNGYLKRYFTFFLKRLYTVTGKDVKEFFDKLDLDTICACVKCSWYNRIVGRTEFCSRYMCFLIMDPVIATTRITGGMKRWNADVEDM